MNSYERLVKNENKRILDEQNLKAESLAHISVVSKDVDGSTLSVLFDKNQSTKLKQFLSLMKEKGFPGSDSLGLYMKRSGKVLSGAEMIVGPSKFGLKNKLKSMSWVKVWHGQGYLIGVIHEKSGFIIPNNSAKIYVCSDGKLRCQRHYPIFIAKHSYSSGYGKIPIYKSLMYRYKFSVGIFEDDNTDDRKSFNELELNYLLEQYTKKNAVVIN